MIHISFVGKEEQSMVYADNAATTKICPEARAAMLEAMDSCYGNPSSLHRAGQQAEDHRKHPEDERVHCTEPRGKAR